MFVSLPELLSHAAAVNHILGVSPFPHKLLDILTQKCTALFPFLQQPEQDHRSEDSSEHRVSRQSHGKQKWHWRTPNAKIHQKVQLLKGIDEFTQTLFGNVTTSQDCTREKKQKLQKRVQQKKCAGQ